MTQQGVPPHGVMEGDGAYNRHAQVQARGVSLTVRFLESAARKIVAGPTGHPIVIADYGSSQGKNSLIPVRAAIDTLRSRVGSDRPILVFHVDQPSNDFNSLFQVLDSDAERYTLNDANVFSSAIGRSFYERVLPSDYVHLAWSSYAVLWLSRIPAHIRGHFFIPRSTGERAEFDRQGARDWENFLSLRSTELRPSGRMIVVVPGLNDCGSPGFTGLMDHANAVLAEMADEGSISVQERGRIVLGAYNRLKSDLLAPFSSEGHFKGLTVESYETFAQPDPVWEDYERDGNRDAFAAKRAPFFRSTFVPSLASVLASTRDLAELRSFGDRLEIGVKRRVAEQPTPIDLNVQVIVLAKQYPT